MVINITMDNLITEFKQILEEEKFSRNTIYQYARYLNEYVRQYGDPAEQPQKLIYKNIKKIQITKKGKKHGDRSVSTTTPSAPKHGDTPSAPKDEGVLKGAPLLTTAKGQTLKSVIAYLKSKGLPSYDLVVLFEDVKKQEAEKAEENKLEADETLPPYMSYYDDVNRLYDTDEPEKIRQYLINKLLVVSNCRNQDLVATIIKTKKELDNMDEKKNYIYVNRNTVKFIRNDYKTVKAYGTKITTVSCEKMANAARIVFQHDENHNLIPEKYWEQNLSRFVHNATFKLGETNIMKMYLKHYNSLSQAKKISCNRGTSLEKLHENYNINQGN